MSDYIYQSICDDKIISGYDPFLHSIRLCNYIFFFIMEEDESKLSSFTDDKGVFITLKNIKELKHGDKSTVIKVKTAQETYFI